MSQIPAYRSTRELLAARGLDSAVFVDVERPAGGQLTLPELQAVIGPKSVELVQVGGAYKYMVAEKINLKALQADRSIKTALCFLEDRRPAAVQPGLPLPPNLLA